MAMSLKTVTLSLEKLFLKTGRRRTIQARAANLAPWLPAAARFATHRLEATVSLETHITCLTGRGELDTLILTSWHVSDSAKVAGIRYSYGAELVMGPHRRRRVPGRIQAPIHGRRRCRPPARGRYRAAPQAGHEWMDPLASRASRRSRWRGRRTRRPAPGSSSRGCRRWRRPSQR